MRYIRNILFMMKYKIKLFVWQTGGPPQYRSRTVFEDATPERVRDFFWDDEFRVESKWDDMLLYHKILEQWPSTGEIVVHWIRKV